MVRTSLSPTDRVLEQEDERETQEIVDATASHGAAATDVPAADAADADADADAGADLSAASGVFDWHAWERAADASSYRHTEQLRQVRGKHAVLAHAM